jgi:TfoX/Sxy family transcriptional regulator of competence genes
VATSVDTIEFLTEQLTAAASHIRTRSMFGEYALYYDDKVVAFICDDQLFVKITPASRPFLDESHDAPAYPGSKPYLCVPADRWDDRDWLERLVVATADSLPLPKPKRPRSAPSHPPRHQGQA